jgi:hypothetical protein
MSVRATIQGFYGGVAPLSLAHLLDRYRDEVREDALREAAERIRDERPQWGGAPGGAWFEWGAAAALIDPDKEGG